MSAQKKPTSSGPRFTLKIRDILLGLISASLFTAIVVIFSVSSRTLMHNELKEQLKILASTSSLLFDARDLEKLRTVRDAKLPEYEKVVKTLNTIRRIHPDVKFAYILRPTENPTLFSFVADADSLHPETPYDMNNDGVIDELDEQTPPGTGYDVSDDPVVILGMREPSTSNEPYSDQWGTFMSGVAPIKDAAGNSVAVIGLDVDYTRFANLVSNAFSPIVMILLGIAATAIAVYLSVSIAQERMQSKRRLEEERNMLLQLNAHQLGSPVTILQWSLETLKSIPESETNLAVAEQIDTLEDVAHRLKNIMLAFHEAERVHAGTMKPEAQKTPVADIVQKAQNEVVKQILRRNQKLTVNVRTTASVMAEEKLITGVLAELLTNASDYSKEKGEITLTVTAEQSMVTVKVQDSGCGIPAKEVDHLFHSFTRASNAARQKPDGSGLGLYIAKGVIERAGGTICLCSTEGKGTTVTFTLPIAA